jgi:hypothetical protein
LYFFIFKMQNSHLGAISRYLPFGVCAMAYDRSGLYLWPGAERLCRFATYNADLFVNKRVLELGAGAGLGSAVPHIPYHA